MAASCPAPVGPVIVFDIATAPAKPLVAAGLPRLVHVSDTVADPPPVKLALVELVTTLKPLTLIERIPEACAPTVGVVTWLILIWAKPSFVAAVTFTALVIVAPPGSVNAAGTR